MTALRPGALVEIEIPAAEGRRVVMRRISTLRCRAGGDYACLLTDPADGGLAAAILAQTDTGRWLCAAPPIPMHPPPPDTRRGRP
ncbi:hypothetical protein [Azospirillum agricola]|uniref:hypothetical protein n=1 Tax=Azospirillum agricola TaxID=1720247 RepID=UPI000A0EEF6E|nr:hypothetical protein [Azospirillum agricola]SMH62562.1 hypothetical protein SAMN02982994_6365 [Azospirillum lipoferum]